MSPFLGEFVGTMLLIIMGDGVVANVVLNKTKGNNSGWIVITFGWAMAVFLGVYASNSLGGSGHLNPAVTIAMTVFNSFDPALLLTYIGTQFAGNDEYAALQIQFLLSWQLVLRLLRIQVYLSCLQLFYYAMVRQTIPCHHLSGGS